MKQRQYVQAGKLTCPIFWALFCENFLGIERRLAKELWSRLYASPELLYQLAKIEDSGRRPEQIKRFGELVTPAMLLQACERLSPSRRGKPRRRDVVQLEEMILQRTGPDRQWL